MIMERSYLGAPQLYESCKRRGSCDHLNNLNVNKGIAFGSPVEGLFDDSGEVGRSSAMT